MTWGDSVTDVSRRRLLRASGAAAGATALSGFAGCQSIPGLGGGGPGPNAAGIGRLTYEPGAVDDVDHYGLSFVDAEAIIEREDPLDDAELLEQFETRHQRLHDLTGVDFDESRAVLSFRTATVLWADHNPSDVGEELDDDFDFDDEDPIQGYEIYVHPDEQSALAFDGSRIIYVRPTSSEDDLEDLIEVILETVAGEEDRYVDGVDAFEPLVGAVEDAHVFRGSTHEPTEETNVEAAAFEAEVARGAAATFDTENEAVDLEFAMVFEGADDVDTGAIEEWTETEAFEDYDEVEVTSDGQVATVSATLDFEAYSLTIPRPTAGVYNYVPAPEAINEFENLNFSAGQPKAVHEDDEASSSFATLIVNQLANPTANMAGIETDTVARAVSFSNAAVIFGDFSDPGSSLTDGGFESDSTYDGMDVYTRDGGDEVVAVGDGVVIGARTGFSGIEARPAVEASIDAARGSGPRYVEENEDVAQLASVVEMEDYVAVQPQERVQRTDLGADEIEGMVGQGIVLGFEGDTTNFEWHLLFETPGDVDMDAVDDWVSEEQSTAGSLIAEANSVNTSRDGRLATVSGNVDTSAIF